jgi:hypothetical protein
MAPICPPRAWLTPGSPLTRFRIDLGGSTAIKDRRRSGESDLDSAATPGLGLEG